MKYVIQINEIDSFINNGFIWYRHADIQFHIKRQNKTFFFFVLEINTNTKYLFL